ncbi:unnamed protein product [Prunus brigantina]
MLLAPSGFAAMVRGTTSLNGAWDPEATWRFDHSIFGRVSHGPRPRPIMPWHKHCPHVPGFFGRGLGRG